MTSKLHEATEWLLRLREDELSEEEMGEWLAWCEADQENLLAFESAQSLWRSIPPAAGAAFARPKRAPVRWKVAALAAGVAALGGSLILLAPRLMDSGRSTGVSRIEAPARVNQDSVLPDGSNVVLGASSAVALDFTAAHRHLNVQNGTAFFRVKSDKARPFVVRAGPVSITAIGTAFNVRRNTQRVVVAVQEGVVKIDGLQQGPLQVSAGQRLTYETKTRTSRLERTDSAPEVAWQHGQLVYNGEPLDVVIENVNRYAATRISLADPSLERLRFTGTVFIDSIDTWLAALPRAFPVEINATTTGITVAAATANAR